MSKVPGNLYYSESHEWLKEEGDGVFTLGVTDHAQESMGDMVFVDLPEVGAKIAVKGECGVLESVKSASDLYSPVAGEITAVNEELVDTPDAVNKDPYGSGWILKIKLDDPAAAKSLMDAASYEEFLKKAE